MFATSVQACINPGLRTEEGTPINPFGGFLIINSSNYPNVLEIEYKLTVVNRNSQGLIVSLEPSSYIEGYASSESIFLKTNSQKILPLTIWIGGQSVWGPVEIKYMCEDGTPQYLNLFFYLVIYGKEISPPPNVSCSTKGLDGCYSGLYRDYSCKKGQLTYTEVCTKSCCTKWGGDGAFCSTDKTTCITENNLPPGTEGNIAFLCAKEDCKDGIEQNIRFLFRLKGWNVTSKPYNLWGEEELKNYDIIACTDQGRACKIAFNSPVYNAHVDKGIPFIEITDSSSAHAAYSFGYISKANGKFVKEQTVLISGNPITRGISGNLIHGSNFIGIEDKLLSSEVIDLDSNEATSFFIVNNSYSHGRYAFLGWFYKSGITSLTINGETIINRTLNWLKYGDVYFGGADNTKPKKGKIAFFCSSDDCRVRMEKDLINFFRSIGYSVKAKSIKSFSLEELNKVNLIVCYGRTCDLGKYPNVYSMHINNQRGFIEIPDSSKVLAAYLFGYINSTKTIRKSTSNISVINADVITNGLGREIRVLTKEKPMIGVLVENLQSVKDLAHISGYNASVLFKSEANISKGRYAMIGWVGRTTFNYFTENGKELLARTINWVNCGKSSC